MGDRSVEAHPFQVFADASPQPDVSSPEDLALRRADAQMDLEAAYISRQGKGAIGRFFANRAINRCMGELEAVQLQIEQLP